MAIDFSSISIVFVIQIFLLLNPLASFPFLIAAYKKKMNVKKVAFGAVLTAFIVAIVIAITGPLLFNMFGITLDSFKVAGGIILLLLGIDMIRAKEEGHLKVDRKADHMISIIATPMLTGPASISFITIKASEIGLIPILINITFAFIFVGAVFYIFSVFVSKINPAVINIVSRIFGLFLSALAIEMIASGALMLLSIG